MDDQLANATCQALANQRNAALDQAAGLTAQAQMLIAENASLKKAVSDLTADKESTLAAAAADNAGLTDQVNLLRDRVQALQAQLQQA